MEEQQYQVYKDMEARTNGEIYIGVVGPVRTGKSTFIKKFMDLLVIPYMEDVHSKERAIDELPQSAAGKTIMTTEPKFIPKEAAKIQLDENTGIQIRLVDCVGFMVEGASGHMEGAKERMVFTPWFPQEIPFSKAAEVGTQKVITEHATVGIVVTTDGSFGDIEEKQYKEAEMRTVQELKQIGKPFLVLYNTIDPQKDEVVEKAKRLEEQYGVRVLPINCETMNKSDLHEIMRQLLYAFPVTQISFYLPKWLRLLDKEHPIRQTFQRHMFSILEKMQALKDARLEQLQYENPYIERINLDGIYMHTGEVVIRMEIKQAYYYEAISQLTGMEITGEVEMVRVLQEISEKKSEYDKMWLANEGVKQKGYGVMTPAVEEITISQPEIIKHGNKYGVKIKATAPSVHLIKANIETEIAPIVGSEEQANDLIDYITNNEKTNPSGIWDTNIFGKSIGQLIEDGIQAKVNKLTDESQLKLQDTMQKVVNDSNGGLVCIII